MKTRIEEMKNFDIKDSGRDVETELELKVLPCH